MINKKIRMLQQSISHTKNKALKSAKDKIYTLSYDPRKPLPAAPTKKYNKKVNEAMVDCMFAHGHK